MTPPQTFVDPSRISRAAAIAQQIEAEIADGGLEPGTRLGTKEDLRLRFGVAAATVNEALKLLDSRGLVDARPGPGGGVFVSAPSASARLSQLVLGFKSSGAPFSECLLVRNALEPLICRDAARLARARDGRALRAIVRRMSRALDDPAGYLLLNWELHRTLAGLSDNATLETLYLTLLDYVESGLQDVRASEFRDAAANLEVHRRLVEAILAGPGPQLEAAIEAHTPIVERWSARER